MRITCSTPGPAVRYYILVGPECTSSYRYRYLTYDPHIIIMYCSRNYCIVVEYCSYARTAFSIVVKASVHRYVKHCVRLAGSAIQNNGAILLQTLMKRDPIQRCDFAVIKDQMPDEDTLCTPTLAQDTAQSKSLFFLTPSYLLPTLNLPTSTTDDKPH
jgi:hypothetical protein